MDDATYDLHGADLAEVRRRVVEPVVHAMLAPDELDWLRVQIGLPHDWWHDGDRRDGASYVWVLLSAGGDQFELQLSKVLFERVDPAPDAGELALRLEHWICCDTQFGWGQLRAADVAVPGTRWPEAPGRLIEVYPEERVASPLWERGVDVRLADLPLSPDLAADLAGWREHCDVTLGSAYDEEDEEVAGWSWYAFVLDLEPERLRLVARLRDELGPEFLVPTPLPLMAWLY